MTFWSLSALGNAADTTTPGGARPGASSSGAGGGWDDDGLGDFSDQSLDGDDGMAGGMEANNSVPLYANNAIPPRQQQQQQQQQQQRRQPPPPPPPPHAQAQLGGATAAGTTLRPNAQNSQRPFGFGSPLVAPPTTATTAAVATQSGGGTVTLGGGMFMGRLTRFIEAVTQPEDEDKGQAQGPGEGWDDDGLDDVVDDNDDNDGGGGHDGWDDDDLGFDDEEPAQGMTENEPGLQQPTNYMAVQGQPTVPLGTSGWGEPLNLSGLEDPHESMTPMPTQAADHGQPDIVVPLNDVPQKGALVDRTPSAGSSRYNRNVSFDTTLAVAGSAQTPGQSMGAEPATSDSPFGWDDDNDIIVSDDDDDGGMHASAVNDNQARTNTMVDRIPPPRPPPPPGPPSHQISALTNSTIASQTVFGARSDVAITSPSAGSNGWDESGDDFDGLDDDDDDENIANPNPSAGAPTGTDAAILGESTADGWGEDDDDGMFDDVDIDEVPPTATAPLVDQTPPPPPPPPPPKGESGRTGTGTGTDAAVADDISRDDTLSMANSRHQSLAGDGSKAEVGQNVVDQTPVSSTECDHNPAEASTAAVAGSVSSVGDSLNSFDNSTRIESRTRPRRMVDHTPPARYQRGMAVDASMAVAGHTSVGESLDSINEENEHVTNGRLQQSSSSTPGGAVISGAATTPAMTGAAANGTSSNENGEAPVVDQTPLPIQKNRSAFASVDALSALSEVGDLGGSDGAGDDVKEDLFGQVVDHTPETPNPAKPKSGKPTETKLEDDTVLGVAERKDVERDIKQDEDMDDESSRGDGTATGTLEDTENRSMLEGSSLRLSAVEEKQLVDHIPESKAPRPFDASTMVLPDGSLASGRVDDNVVDIDDDGTTPVGFGPIVDHTPSVIHPTSRVHRSSRSVRSVATSVVTQVSGLEADLKEDDDFQNPDTATEAELDDHHIPLAPPAGDEKHVVDHVPKRRSHRVTMDASMRVLVDNGDDTTQVDTIAEDAVANFGPVVDQTPVGARSSTYSVADSMANHTGGKDDLDNTTGPGGSIGGGPGWDNYEPDLEELSTLDRQTTHANGENNLVDHVPQRTLNRATNVSTTVLVDPLDGVSEVEDVDDERRGRGRFGPVVDHTPRAGSSGAHVSVENSMLTQASGAATDIRHDDDMDGTWFGASTVGGVSTVGASTAEDASRSDDSTGGNGSGWDGDDVLDVVVSPTQPRPTAQDGDHMVDYLPSIGSPRTVDTTTAVLADRSVVSSQNVRHNAASAQGDGWDRDEPELEELENAAAAAAADDDEMPPLVDHVPERPESRPTDASTYVAADPSEMGSQVDDFGQDEAHFGPVVDVTPPSQLNAPPSAAGSTIVALNSVAADDLDEAVETAIHGEDENTAEEGPPNEWEQVPNPQSGSPEDNNDTNEEQLVDYLPPVNDEEVPDLVRDGSSEMATVGEKSALPADDPKEDEFGPVVDQLPTRDASMSPIDERRVAAGVASSAATQPPMEATKKVADSVAPNFSVASKQDKDADGLDEDGFGPVVDQLPTVSSKSFPPSRGGSTVDALATVSEVDDDLVIEDGWEDDAEIEVTDQTSPAATGRSVEDRNLSVKWIDGLHSKSDSATQPQKGTTTTNNNNNMSKLPLNTSTDSASASFFDAEMGDPNHSALNETRYFDPEVGESDVWNDDSLHIDGLNNLDDEDDTPPSTPRNSNSQFNSKNDAWEIGVKAEAAAKLKRAPVLECNVSAPSSSPNVPSVEQLLDDSRGTDGLVGIWKTPEGDDAQINFDELLQTEITKRKLIEKESQALRAAVQALKASKETLVLAGESQMDVLTKLHNSNKGLNENLENVRDECNKLRAQNEALQRNVRAFSDKESSFGSQQIQWQREESNYKSTIDSLKQQLKDATAATDQKVDSLKAESAKMKDSLERTNDDLASQISQLETECANLRGKNESLYEDLATYRESVSELTEGRASAESRESALRAEVIHLKDSLEVQQSAKANTNAQLREQLVTVQSTLATKTGECAELQSMTEQLQRRVTASEAENFRHAKEFARLSKEHNQSMLDLENRLDASKKALEEARKEKEEATNELQQKLDSQADMVQNLTSEKNTLEERMRQATSNQKSKEMEHEKEISSLKSEYELAKKNLLTLEGNKKKLSEELSKQREKAKEVESLTVQNLTTTRERDVLKEALVESKRIIARLRKQMTEDTETVKRREQELRNSLNNEREKGTTELDTAKKTIDQLSKKVRDAESAKKELQEECKELSEKCQRLETQTQDSTLGSQKGEERNTELQTEIDDLKQQLRSAEQQQQAGHTKRLVLEGRISELDKELRTVRDELQASLGKSNFVEYELSKTLETLRAVQSKMDDVAADRDRLKKLYDELEDSSTAATNHLQQVTPEVAEERERLLDEVERLQQIQDGQSRKIEELESELEKGDSLLANKDQIIVILKEQQKSSRSGFQDLQKTNKEHIAQIEDLQRLVSVLEEERDTLKGHMDGNASKLNDMRADLNRLANERDTAFEERDTIIEDNEEMLVQFGILKEEMDASAEMLGDMQDALRNREMVIADLEDRLEESEGRYEALSKDLQTNGEDDHNDKNRFEALNQHEHDQLVKDKAALEAMVEELSARNQGLEEQQVALEQEKSDRTNEVTELEGRIATILESNQAKESELQSAVADAKKRCNDLTVQCEEAEEEIAKLREEVSEKESILQDVDNLQRQVQELEVLNGESQMLLQQKDAAIQDLFYQLQNAGNTPEASAEVEALRGSMQALQADAELARGKIHELQTEVRESKFRLSQTLEQMSSMDRVADQLRAELASREDSEAMCRNLEVSLRRAEQNLEEANERLSKSEREGTELLQKIALLEVELQQNRIQSSQATDHANAKASAEMASLRTATEQLKQQLARSKNEAKAREAQVGIQKKTFDEQEAKLNGRIAELETEIKSQKSVVERAKEDAASKGEKVEKLVSELDTLREQANRPATSRVLELTRDEAEGVDQMRSHIVSLARALEQSEVRRAEAIERLEKERRTHGDSLCRLTESLKRFYSNLRLEET